MKIKFKKIMSVVGSVFLVGATIGMAAAAGGSFPMPFVKNNVVDTAIVYGTGSAASDLTAANSINTYLKTFEQLSSTTSTGSSSTTSASSITGDFSSSVNIYDEIALGGDDITSSKLKVKLEDNKLSTLLDTKISWDNGEGSDNYDVHEEILLTNFDGTNDVSKLKLVTNLNHPDGEDFDSYVVLQNDESLRYRLVFDDELEDKGDSEDPMEDLEVTILGKEYKITNFNDDFTEITISSSNEIIVDVGGSFVVDGKTFTVEDIFEETVEINGRLIDEEKTKTINDIEIEVVNIGYHSSVPGYTNKVILNVGKDIKRNIDSGDEYIKGDETWEWDIGRVGDVMDGKQYIGVRYALSNVDYDEDDDDGENPISVGQSYIFPENYAALSFDSLTDVTYNDFELFFDKERLYDGLDSQDDEKKNVAILEGEEDDSFTLMYDNNEVETDSIYFELKKAIGEDISGVNIYFKDIDEDASDNDGRIQDSFIDGDLTDGELSDVLAKLVVKDTILDVRIYLEGDVVILTLTNLEDDVNMMMSLGHSGGEFKHLGVDEEESEALDVVNGEDIGNMEYDVMDNYGIIIQNPENYAENDMVLFSVPSEQVFATISVKGQGEEVVTTNVTTTNQTTNETTIIPNVKLGAILVKDTEINSVKDKNLIIIGGSCINAEAAKLLGGKACGTDFTLKTGVVAGKALVKSIVSPYNANKVAVVVAGYHAADTTRAINSIVNTNIDLSVGQTYTI